MATAIENPRMFGYDRDRREFWFAPTAYDASRPKAGSRGKKLDGKRKVG
jgi:hypothetical protein